MTKIFYALAIIFLASTSSNAAALNRKLTNENQLSYVDTGNPHGVPVVLVHAFPLNQRMWDSQVAALKKLNRVIIRGLGKSDLESPYTLEFVVDDLIEILDRLKIDKTVICGLSMGGFVALRAIERNPERFSGLVLADTKSEPDSDISKIGRYKALKTIQEQGLNTFVEGFLKSSLTPETLTQRPQIFENAKSVAETNTSAGVSAALLALTSRTDTSGSLSEIRVPTLILQGEFDSVIPLDSAKSLHDKIKGSTFSIVTKAGHLSNLENPEFFNKQLLSFMRSVRN